MKKLLALLLAMMLVVSLAACGGNTATSEPPSEPTKDAQSEAPVDTQTPETQAPVEPAGDEWTKQVVVTYFFEETGEDVEMTIKTNDDQSKYNFTFLFFGDEQNMTCTADAEVLEDLTGFIGKDAQNYLDFIAENVAASDWQPIGGGAEGGSDWTKQTVVTYFFEETGEDVEMTIKTNNDQSKYNFTFMFFGDPQDMTCTADAEVLADKTGFIGKDAQNYLAFIAENVTDADWQPIG